MIQDSIKKNIPKKIKIFYKKLFSSFFAQNVAIITSGTVLSQFINTFLAPIITRIYSPEEYGVLTVYVAVIGLFSIISSLKYEWAIPIAKDEEEAVNVLILCVFILFLYSIGVFILLFFFNGPILEALVGNSLGSYWVYVPLGILLIGIYQILMQWAYRERDYQRIARTKVMQAIFQNVSRIGLYFVGSTGLIISRILGESTGILTLFSNVKNFLEKYIQGINFRSIKKVAIRFKRFPFFSLPSQFFNMLGIQLPPILMTSLYGSKEVGFFGLANVVTTLPMILVGNSIGDVFYGEAAGVDKNNIERIKELSNKLLIKLLKISIVPFGLLVILSPWLFSTVFGEEWHPAGRYSQAISILVFFRFVFTPGSRIFAVIEKQHYALVVDFIRVVLVIASFIISNLFDVTSYITVLIYSISMSLIYLLTYLLAQKALNDKIEETDNIGR